MIARVLCGCLVVVTGLMAAEAPFEETWAAGALDPERWYAPRKQWGQGNHGVVPENVGFAMDTVFGRQQRVLVLTGNGDAYTGDVVGKWGRRNRVGGMVVSKRFFASGTYEVVFKICANDAGEPPVGMVPAIWTYAYRFVKHREGKYKQFDRENPAYHPVLDRYKWGGCEYWSEIDFPEFGKEQKLEEGLWNTFINANHDSRVWPTPGVLDGKYHTVRMTWTTELRPVPEVTDAQVAEADGFWWVQDPTVPFEAYRGNPLKRVGKDAYLVYAGKKCVYELDGREVGSTTKFVPSMAAQLSLGVWFPKWGGAAPWQRAELRIARVTVTPLNNPGDCFGFLTEDLADSFEPSGKPIKR